MLGPNGSGKSTLFRLISTLVPVQSGSIHVLGLDVMQRRSEVRHCLGVVFQSPSLDRKLTVRENMECQAALYGITGVERKERISLLARKMGLDDRLGDRCEKLSGGMKRRAELAKGLLHRPRLLILDEPSTGLDPSARLELWQALETLREEWNTTILLTTHLLDEADKCDRLAILDGGRLVALDSPENLRKETGETVISVASHEPLRIAALLKERFGWEPSVVGDGVRVVTHESSQCVSEVLVLLGSSVHSVTVGRPGLEDVFLRKTGSTFLGE
jgi:ABC-2 type transport system ATP-binding protein